MRTETWMLGVSCALMMIGCDGEAEPGLDAGAATAFELQVDRGAGLYATHCAGCHGDMGQGTSQAPRLVGLAEGALPLDPPPGAMVRSAQFVTAGDIATFAATNMPADDPGSLATDEYVAILAFALFANGVTMDEALTLESAAELTIPR